MSVKSLRRWPVVALALFASVAASADWRQLAADLSSADEAARIRARQLLPREGVAPLPSLIPLLAQENQPIRLAARNVIADILNGAAAPGHEADQLFAANQMMNCLAPDKPQVQVELGLRLLPIIVPEGFDVGPVAALLTNADLCEKARACLEEIGTDNACTALLNAVSAADPVFAAALIDAAGKLQKKRSTEPLTAFLSHADADVRAAAAMALSWTGDSGLVPTFKTIAAESTPEIQFKAYDALLRLTDAIVLKGGNWNLAMDLYCDVLATGPTYIIRATAMMGLGRYGDASVVDSIVAGIPADDPDMADTAVQALSSLKGLEAIKAVMKVYPGLSQPIRVGLLNGWGQRRELATLDLVKEELNSTTPEVRSAALHALAAMQSMQAFAALVDVARNGNDEEKAFALASVRGMAGSLGSAGNAQAAGLAYMQLYQLATDDDLRRICVQGLERYPVPQAYDLVKGLLENAALKDAAVPAYVAVAGAVAAEDKEKAKEAFDLVRSMDISPELLVQLAQRLQGAGVPADLANLLGVVKRWQIIGPFDWKSDADWDTAFVGEPNVDLAATFKAGDATLAWKPAVTEDALGLVNLAGLIAQRDRCFGYAYAEVDVPEDTAAQVRIGSDDGNKVWVNGEKAWENRVDRGAALDQDKADIRLVKGRNCILVKISQGAGGWNFMLRLALPTGAGVTFTQPE